MSGANFISAHPLAQAEVQGQQHRSHPGCPLSRTDQERGWRRRFTGQAHGCWLNLVNTVYVVVERADPRSRQRSHIAQSANQVDDRFGTFRTLPCLLGSTVAAG